MHYTHSIGKTAPSARPSYENVLNSSPLADYAIVMHGEVVMGTSDGKRTSVKAGELIVQLGMLHDWTNETDDWVRIIFVGLESKPIVIDGKPITGDRME